MLCASPECIKVNWWVLQGRKVSLRAWGSYKYGHKSHFISRPIYLPSYWPTDLPTYLPVKSFYRTIVSCFYLILKLYKIADLIYQLLLVAKKVLFAVKYFPNITSVTIDLYIIRDDGMAVEATTHQQRRSIWPVPKKGCGQICAGAKSWLHQRDQCKNSLTFNSINFPKLRALFLSKA